MNDNADPLAELRRQIDAADDAIFDLLKKRAALAGSVGASKAGEKRAVYRPAREAQIMRRLVARSSDPAEAASMIRIWRALIADSYARQGGVHVVADRAVAGLARGHFSTEAIGVEPSASAACVILHTTNYGVSYPPPKIRWNVAVTRIPAPAGPHSWFAWTVDMRQMKVPLYVCGRLPFYAVSLETETEALVYGVSTPDPSGQDTTLIAAPPAAAPAGATKVWQGRLRDPLSVFAIEGYLKPDDPTLKRDRIVWLGAYPRPLGPSGPRPDIFAEKK